MVTTATLIRSSCARVALYTLAYQATQSALVYAMLLWEASSADQMVMAHWIPNTNALLLTSILVLVTIVPAALIWLGKVSQGVLAFALTQIATVLLGLALRSSLLASTLGVAG